MPAPQLARARSHTVPLFYPLDPADPANPAQVREEQPRQPVVLELLILIGIGDRRVHLRRWDSENHPFDSLEPTA